MSLFGAHTIQCDRIGTYGKVCAAHIWKLTFQCVCMGRFCESMCVAVCIVCSQKSRDCYALFASNMFVQGVLLLLFFISLRFFSFFYVLLLCSLNTFLKPSKSRRRRLSAVFRCKRRKHTEWHQFWWTFLCVCFFFQHLTYSNHIERKKKQHKEIVSFLNGCVVIITLARI